MHTLDTEIAKIVQDARIRLNPAHLRSLPTREEQLRMEFALSIVDFLPSGVNLLSYDLASNPHLPFVLSEDEPWKCALALEAQDDTLRPLPKLRLDARLTATIEMPEWAAA
ncbi:MAG TPA: hypothetical protein VGG22_06705 [Candidatus Baltobacteraceae bacterium]|jgi:hypothetical protein